jgi:hypothetical protein
MSDRHQKISASLQPDHEEAQMSDELPISSAVRIASPCQQGWDTMIGDDLVRFCGKCKLNVFNISELTESEAEVLIHKKEGRICARLYQRSDGTVITQKCPYPVRQAHRDIIVMTLRGLLPSAVALTVTLLINGVYNTIGPFHFYESGDRAVMGDIEVPNLVWVAQRDIKPGESFGRQSPQIVKFKVVVQAKVGMNAVTTEASSFRAKKRIRRGTIIRLEDVEVARPAESCTPEDDGSDNTPTTLKLCDGPE